jgi:AcrR family transcriptional regulator
MTAQGLFGNEASHLGKSARTRARLMDAAVQLFARDGFEAASVNEIAKVAGVVNGTFYVHFRDKDEIAGAVALAIGRNVVRQLDEAMVGVDDAVERSSLATRRFIELAASQPDWGGALVRAVMRFRDMRDGMIAYLRADLQQGVDQGAFTVVLDDLLIDTFASMTMGALAGRLRGDFGPDAGSRVSELQLRMLGVAPEQARRSAWRDLPQVTLDLTPSRRT